MHTICPCSVLTIVFAAKTTASKQSVNTADLGFCVGMACSAMFAGLIAAGATQPANSENVEPGLSPQVDCESSNAENTEPGKDPVKGTMTTLCPCMSNGNGPGALQNSGEDTA